MTFILKNGFQPICNGYLVLRNLQQSSSARSKWDLLTAVCIERKPVIPPLLNEIQEKFQKLLSQLEYEQSLKSDHELQHEYDLKQQELLKKGQVDLDVSSKETAQDFLDARHEELSQFKFADRITDADKENNMKSVERKLDKHLVLVLKQKLGNQNIFLLPQGVRQDGETLRQTAERVLKESCGSDMKVHFYGNAPCGFYKYTYPVSVQKESGTVGAKVFMYFARHSCGVPTETTDFKWLDRGELRKELHTKYHKSLADFLIDEK